MPEVCDGIRARLFLLADPAYRAFQQPLIPTVPPERVIGVRAAALLLSPLDYPFAKPGGAVNGECSPFILTVDCSGWVCYLLF